MLIIVFRTLILYILVIIVMRLMGKRQITQLQPFELAVTIMISELAAIPMGETGIPLMHGVLPILTLLILQLLVSLLTIKIHGAENLISGKPTILIENGKILKKHLEKELYTLNDLLEQIRLKGYLSIDDIAYAILESSGELSVIPKTQKRHPTLEEMNIVGTAQTLALPVILDGKLVLENIHTLEFDTGQFHNLLNREKIERISDVLFASLDTSGKLFYQLREPKEGSSYASI